MSKQGNYNIYNDNYGKPYNTNPRFNRNPSLDLKETMKQKMMLQSGDNFKTQPIVDYNNIDEIPIINLEDKKEYFKESKFYFDSFEKDESLSQISNGLIVFNLSNYTSNGAGISNIVKIEIDSGNMPNIFNPIGITGPDYFIYRDVLMNIGELSLETGYVYKNRLTNIRSQAHFNFKIENGSSYWPDIVPREQTLVLTKPITFLSTLSLNLLSSPFYQKIPFRRDILTVTAIAGSNPAAFNFNLGSISDLGPENPPLTPIPVFIKNFNSANNTINNSVANNGLGHFITAINTPLINQFQIATLDFTALLLDTQCLMYIAFNRFTIGMTFTSITNEKTQGLTFTQG